MSHRYYWYEISSKMVKRYKKLEKKVKPEREWKKAIDEIFDEIRTQKDGEERIEVIEMVLINQTHTISGAAQKIPTSWWTAQRYCADFITRVGMRYGYR